MGTRAVEPNQRSFKVSASKTRQAAFKKYTTPERYQAALDKKHASINRKRARENCPHIAAYDGRKPTDSEVAAALGITVSNPLDIWRFRARFREVSPFYARGCCVPANPASGFFTCQASNEIGECLVIRTAAAFDGGRFSYHTMGLSRKWGIPGTRKPRIDVCDVAKLREVPDV